MALIYSSDDSSIGFDATSSGSTPTNWVAITGTWHVGTTTPISAHTHSFGDTDQGSGDMAVCSGVTAQTNSVITFAQKAAASSGSGALLGTMSRSDGTNQNNVVIILDGSLNLNIYEEIGGTFNNRNNHAATVTAYSAGDIILFKQLSLASIVYAKAWKSTQAEPAAWDVSATMTTLTGSGAAGLRDNSLGSIAMSASDYAIDSVPDVTNFITFLSPAFDSTPTSTKTINFVYNGTAPTAIDYMVDNSGSFTAATNFVDNGGGTGHCDIVTPATGVHNITFRDHNNTTHTSTIIASLTFSGSGVTLTGVAGTGSVGSFSISISSNVTLTGVQGTGSVGTFSPSTGFSGVQGNGSVGSFVISSSSTITLTGVGGTGGVGYFANSSPLVRTTSGLLLSEDFNSLSGWSADANWSSSGTYPTIRAYSSPYTLLHRTVSGDESAVLREVTPFILGTNTWYLGYDATNGIANWVTHLSYSTDYGRTWTRYGPMSSIAPSCHGGNFQDGSDGNFYFLGALAGGGFSGTIPVPPYQTMMYRISYADFVNPATNLTNWSFVYGPAPTLGPGFDDNTHLLSCIISFSGSYNAWASTETNTGTTRWTSGHDTVATFATAPVKDGLGPDESAAINNNTGTGGRVESPHVWFSKRLASWIKSANRIDSGGTQAVGNDAYIVAGSVGSVPDWRGVGAYRQLLLTGVGNICIGAMGYMAPLIDRFGIALLETDDSVGFYYDANNTNNTSPHMDRDLFQGQVETSIKSARYAAGTPGNSTVAYLLNNTTNANFMMEFELDFESTITSPNATIGVVYRSTNGKDATGQGYVLNISGLAGATIDLYRFNSGSGNVQLIGSSSAHTFPVNFDALNQQLNTFRLEVTGNVHKLYSLNENVLLLNLTDTGTNGGVISTGDYLGFRAVGAVANIRHLTVRKSADVVVNGCSPGGTVVLHGASGIIYATAVADGSGIATLTSPHYQMYYIEVGGILYTPQDGGLVWGGDVFQAGVSFTGVQGTGAVGAFTSTIGSMAINPTSGHTRGAVAVTATGTNTTWGVTNPFSVIIGGAFASISGYSNVSPTSATFNLNISSNSGLVTISDGGNSANYTATAVAPGAPVIGTLTDNHNGTVTIAFSPPVDDGGADISLYTATDSVAGSNTGASSPITISGIALGSAQTVKVKATNSAGTGADSANSNSVTPITNPGPPTSLVATPGRRQVSVTFVAPASNGGGAITGYTVTCSAGGTDTNAGSTALTHVVTGLPDNASVTCTAIATNSYGPSVPSAPCAAVFTFGFSLVPAGASITGVQHVTATGHGTNWSTNTFSITSGPGTTLTNYVNLSATSATFDFTVTGLTGIAVVIHDSDSNTDFNFTTGQAKGGFVANVGRMMTR